MTEWTGPAAAADVEDQGDELDPLDRQAVGLFLDELAPRLAAELLDRLQPGLGPMTLGAGVARAVSAAAPWHQEMVVGPRGVDELRLALAFQPSGAIALELRWQSGVQVWAGVLRPAGVRK